MQSPADFIAAMGNDALRVINGDYSTDQKKEYFRLLLRQDFDLGAFGPFVLGPYWRVASEAERQEFMRLLEDYTLVTFGRRIAEYGGGATFRVLGTRGTPYDPIVISEIARAGAAPLRVEWVMHARGGTVRVVDVVVDGVSMTATQRSEFGAIIQRVGGTIPAFLAYLRDAIFAGHP